MSSTALARSASVPLLRREMSVFRSVITLRGGAGGMIRSRKNGNRIESTTLSAAFDASHPHGKTVG